MSAWLSALLLALTLAEAAAADCAGAPHAGPWDFVAGRMSVEGRFTPMGGGAVKARVEVPDCSGTIEAVIDTVGAITFESVDGVRYRAVRLPPGFSAGINWDLQVHSPTELTSTVYFKEPAEHLQAHRWTYAGAPVLPAEPPAAPPAGPPGAPPAGPPGDRPEPPDALDIRQGLWGYVTHGELLGRFHANPAAGGDVRPVSCLPPAANGFYMLPAEPGETGWFCMIDGPCDDAKLSSECVSWAAERGLKYCGLHETGWDC